MTDHVCPKCAATVTTFAGATVGHRCPMARGNAFTVFAVQVEDREQVSA